MLRRLNCSQRGAVLRAGTTPLAEAPQINGYHLELAQEGRQLIYSFDAQADDTGIASLLKQLSERGIDFKDLHTEQSSLEDIFVSLVHAK